MSDAPRSVELWVASPPALAETGAAAELERLLTDEERAACARFRAPEHRLEHRVTRALARVALGEALGVDPTSLAFRRTEHGRPVLIPEVTLRWNLANHPSLVVCALTDGAEIGVDVEPLSRGAEILPLAARVFSDEEQRALEALQEQERCVRAVSIWTAKEAYLKARGTGLGMPLGRITVRLEPPAPRLQFEAPADDDAARWTLRSFALVQHRITVCIEGALGEVRVRPFGPLPRS